MRVIAGLAKGRRLVVPKGQIVRPTSDYLRGALFNILGGRVVGTTFLDLFAGTGSVGIEALSRGAASATFVEKNSSSLRALWENLRRAGFKGQAEVIHADVLSLLKGPSFRRPYDVIFLDPPYRDPSAEKVLTLLAQGGVLKPGGIVIAEGFHKRLLPQGAGPLKLTREIRHGETTLAFYVLECIRETLRTGI